MAGSAIRKSLWVNHRFDEGMLISEDLEWSYRIKKKGHKVLYAKDSIVTHHHNYTIKELYHRHVKEGIDSAKIFSINGKPLAFVPEGISLSISLFNYPGYP